MEMEVFLKTVNIFAEVLPVSQDKIKHAKSSLIPHVDLAKHLH